MISLTAKKENKEKQYHLYSLSKKVQGTNAKKVHLRLETFDISFIKNIQGEA